MSEKTPNINLELFTNTDGSVNFADFWNTINFKNDGTTKEYSAFQKIDTKFGQNDASISTLNTNVSELQTAINTKQDILTPGIGIDIDSDKTISNKSQFGYLSDGTEILAVYEGALGVSQVTLDASVCPTPFTRLIFEWAFDTVEHGAICGDTTATWSSPDLLFPVKTTIDATEYRKVNSWMGFDDLPEAYEEYRYAWFVNDTSPGILITSSNSLAVDLTAKDGRKLAQKTGFKRLRIIFARAMQGPKQTNIETTVAGVNTTAVTRATYSDGVRTTNTTVGNDGHTTGITLQQEDESLTTFTDPVSNVSYSVCDQINLLSAQKLLFETSSCKTTDYLIPSGTIPENLSVGVLAISIEMEYSEFITLIKSHPNPWTFTLTNMGSTSSITRTAAIMRPMFRKKISGTAVTTNTCDYVYCKFAYVVDKTATSDPTQQIQSNLISVALSSSDGSIITASFTYSVQVYSGGELITSGVSKLSPATTTTLGGIKVGDNLSITSAGVLSATASGGLADCFYNPVGLAYAQTIHDAWDSTLTTAANKYQSDTNLIYMPWIDTGNVTDMTYMFNGCTSLQTVPLFVTSNVTNMGGMFQSCTSLQTVPLFKTYHVKNMSWLFSLCVTLQTVPLFVTSNVTSMSQMFSNCTSLQTVPLFATSNVTDMSSMFCNCTSLQTVPLFATSNVTDMSSMFCNCNSLQTVALSGTGNVTNMSGMFDGCTKMTTFPTFSLYAVTNASYMFSDCHEITGTFTSYGTHVTNMDYMFYSCTSMTKQPSILYDSSRHAISEVTTRHMFDTCLALTEGTPDLTGVIATDYMYNMCNSLTTFVASGMPILIQTATGMFSQCLNLTSVDFSVILSCAQMTDLTDMFSDCSKLTSVRMHGVRVSFDISASTLFTEASLVTLISDLADVSGETFESGSGPILTMGYDNLNKLTPEEVAVATAKSWTLY